jgi:tetratricopeptide (TPR) repeat protein
MDSPEFRQRSARTLCLLCAYVSLTALPSATAAQKASGGGQPKTRTIPITTTDSKAAPAALTATPDRYATEPAVIERNDRESVFAADGTGFETQSIVIRVQTDAAVKNLGVISFSYASASQRVDIEYLRVRHPDGTVIETPVAEALDMPSEIMRQAPFYSDLKEKQVPVRGLRAGDKLEWSIRLVRTKAEAPGRFWGISNFTGKERVALAETFTLRLPKAVPANVWSPKQPAKITEEGSDRVYRWTSSQLEPTVGPEAQARTEKEKKRVLSEDEVTDRTEGALPTIAWTNFPDWAAVGDWYHSLETGRITPDDAIKSKAAELIAGKTSDEDKIKALYTYASTQIRYIGVALGQGRYQPHLASEVLSNQYGDCKDKATLLASLLSAAGYSADTALIGAGIRFNQAVPSPAAFNHAITAISIGSGDGKKTIWLDSTQEAAPYQALVFAIRDKNALRVPQNGSAYLDRTPANLPFASFERFDAKSTLAAEGVATGRITITARGDDEIALRGAARQFSPAQYDQFVQYLIANLGYAGKATHSTIISPDNSDKPLEISFDYERDKPGDWANYRISPQFPPDELPTVDEKEPPQTPIQLGVPRTQTSMSEFKLPQGWSATLPDAIHRESPWVKYDKTYRLEKGTVSSERTIVILQAKIPASKWADYKKFTDDISAGQDQWITLTRPNGSTDATPGPPPPSKDDPKARELVQQAAEANQQHQLDSSGDLLAQAKAINDEQPYLWSVTGYRAMLRGEMTEAVTDYKKELALHPNEENIYQLLANTQLGQGNKTDAEATLRSRLKTIGPDESTSLKLAQVLLDDDNPKEALAVADAASKADYTNQRLRWMLGRARLKAGQKAAGTSTLLAALREADDPGLRNDIAYELVDNGQWTPEVEEAARKEVDQISTKTAAWSLTDADQDINEMRKQTALLVASWDTLGWAIYKSETGKDPGRLAEAERYIAAAWHNSLRGEVGLHLGELQAAQKHSAEALATYQVARASTPEFNGLGIRQPPNALQRDLDDRIDRLKKLLPKAALEDPAHTLRDQLQLDAGSYKGDNLVLPYRFLLSADGIQTPVPLHSIAGDQGKPDPVRDSKRIEQAIPKTWIPTGSSARLLRSVILNCHQSSCDLAVMPLMATH